MKKLLVNLLGLIYLITPFESVALVSGISLVKVITVPLLFLAIYCFKSLPLPSYKFFFWFSAYTVLVLFSWMWSIDFSMSLSKALGTILPSYVLTLYAFRILDSRNDVFVMLKFQLIGAVCVALFAIANYYSTYQFIETVNESRVTVFGQDQNELSYLMITGVAAGFLLLNNFSSVRVLRFLLMSCILILTYSILLTGSRTGFIILLLVFACRLISDGSLFRTGVYLASLTTVGMVAPSAMMDRLIDGTTNELAEGSLTGRTEVWSLGWEASIQEGSYILGVGFHTFRDLMNKYYQWPKAPHNTFLSTWVGLGGLGLIFYILMLSSIFRLTKKVSSVETTLIWVLVIPVFVVMFTLGIETRRWLYLQSTLILVLYRSHFNQSTSKIKFKNS